MLHRSLILAGLMFLALGTDPVYTATLHVPQDFKTIQAAIDSAHPGDAVLVETGTYQERIRLKERVTLRSAGDDAQGKIGLKRAEATIINGGGALGKGPGAVLAEGAVLDGFTITFVGLFDQKEYDMHYATSGENLPDERGAVGAGEDFPAVAVPGVTATVKNCIVHDNGHAGIGCTGAEGKRNASHIFKNIVYRNMGGGIGISDGAMSTVEANCCYNNLRGGIGNRKSAGIILKNECFDNVRAGIGIREGATPIVRGNKCYKNQRAGIGSRMEGTSPLIEDNDCYQNKMAGIGSRDGASPFIRNNRCYENMHAGIGSRDGSRAIIYNNKCYRNKEAGIGSQLGARPIILRNECYENELAGIGQRSDAETFLGGNYVHHNKLAGIGFDDCAAGKSTVLNNQVVDNGLVAIGIHSGWTVRIANNVLSREGGLPPIVMVFKGAEADFAENTITGSGVAGIRTEGKVRIVNNKFECPSLRKGGGPPQFAVWGLPGSDITFLENTVNDWRHALSADMATVNASYNKISGYWQAGIRITQPVEAVVLLDNVFQSADGQPGVVLPKEYEGLVDGNREEKLKPAESGK